MGFMRRMRRKAEATTRGEPELRTGNPGDVRKCPKDQNVLHLVYIAGDEDPGRDRVGMICPRCGRLYEERAQGYFEGGESTDAADA